MQKPNLTLLEKYRKIKKFFEISSVFLQKFFCNSIKIHLILVCCCYLNNILDIIYHISYVGRYEIR